jgi:2-phosphosulfolactate phosphatase
VNTPAALGLTTIDRARVYVHLLPSLIPPGCLHGGIAVVVDVLRASTAMVYALAAGCEAIVPCSEIDEAKAVAATLPAGSALLAGERQGLPIPGFDLGNSPEEFTPEVCKDRTVVMTTTNGTRAVLASLEADRVYIASFANLRAISQEISVQLLKKDHGSSVHVICAGTEGFISFEDSLLAGALARDAAQIIPRASPDNTVMGNDEALVAAYQWLAAAQGLRERPLTRLLRLGRGGQNVERIGLDADIAAAAQVNRFDLVAEVNRDPLRIVAV